MVSAPAWDGTGREFDSWQCRINIPCSLSLRLLGSLRRSLGTYGKNCVLKKRIYCIFINSSVPYMSYCIYFTKTYKCYSRLIILLRLPRDFPMVDGCNIFSTITDNYYPVFFLYSIYQRSMLQGPHGNSRLPLMTLKW